MMKTKVPLDDYRSLELRLPIVYEKRLKQPPEVVLARAVVLQALKDIRSSNPDIVQHAIDWIITNGENFRWWCVAGKIDPDAVRDRLLKLLN